ncbi:conserved hypothetical protein [Magnetospirillum sp. LM-5]|nr:conserved hypothetical protein [Magnetospirillum sp. LM-5]
MVHGAVRSLFQLLGALVVGLLVALPLLLWRLSEGPISLAFLTPYIEEALTARDGGFSVRLDDTVLALSGKGNRLEIRAIGVQAFAGESPQLVAVIPEMALSLNGRALVRGVIAPNSVSLYRPRLMLVRGTDGNIQWGIGVDQGIEAPVADTGSADPVRRLLEALVGEPDPSQPGRHLQRAAIIDADLMVDDRLLGVQWHAPDVDLTMKRIPQGLTVSAAMALDLAGEQGSVEAEATYAKADNSINGELFISGIRPAALARIGGPLTPLKLLDLPLAGMVRVKGHLDGSLPDLEIEMAGGAGTLDLPAPVDMHRTVDSVSLKLAARAGLSQVVLQELAIDFGGPVLSLTAKAEGLGGASQVTLDATLTNVPFDELPRLWPAIVAPNARDWVLANMSKGIAREAKASISGRSALGTFEDLVIDHVGGEIKGDGVTVDYLRPMPAVKNAAAIATFDTKDFRINVKAGDVYGLKAKDGLIILGGLDQPDQFADIDLTIHGPAADALKVIDSKPLRYAQALGIDPQTVGGDAQARVRLKFPLLKNLRLDDVAVNVTAQVKKVSLPQVVMGLDLTDGELDLTVDAKGLDAKGPIVLGSIPGELKWRENFSKNAPFRSRYDVKAPAIDEAQRRLLGLDTVPFVAPFLTGPVAAQVNATLYGGGKGDIEVRADLSTAAMQLPGLGWRKEVRTTGGAELSIRLDNNKLAAIPRFAVNAGDLSTKGSVGFGSDGKIRRVEFARLAYGGRTDIEGAIGFRPNGAGLDITAKGEQFNAEPIVGKEDERAGDAEARARDGARKRKADLPPMSVNGQIKTMWLSKSGKLTNASVALARDGDDWHTVTVKGGLPGDKHFLAEIRPGGPKRRTVKVTSDDAGETLRAFDSYEHLMGGSLEVEGAYDDSKEDQPLSGLVRITDYNIVKAPALARLLTVAALSGIVDVLKGEGVGFSTLDAPFTLTDGLLAVKDARAYGAALGITGSGEIDVDASRIALEGTVVPAYALNSALGKIPVLGWLVTGGEKGGGLVAFNYRMKGPTADPDVWVNPLSALTPGFLRNLFNIFDDGSETEARKRPAPAKKPPPETAPAQ